MKLLIRCLWIALLLSSIVRAGDERVTVEKAEADVKRHRFDPDRPPPDMPKFKPGEAAVTTSSFSIRAEVTGELTEQSRKSGGVVAAKMRIGSIRVRISLEIDIWLPFDAPQELRDHEEGHRKLNEYYYGD